MDVVAPKGFTLAFKLLCDNRLFTDVVKVSNMGWQGGTRQPFQPAERVLDALVHIANLVMAGEPVTVDAAEHQKLMDAWALAIGRFMVAFTSCEYWTYLFVETFGSKRLRDATGDLMLGARAPLAKSLVLDIGLIDASKPWPTLVSTRERQRCSTPQLALEARQRGTRTRSGRRAARSASSRRFRLTRRSHGTIGERGLRSFLVLSSTLIGHLADSPGCRRFPPAGFGQRQRDAE